MICKLRPWCKLFAGLVLGLGSALPAMAAYPDRTVHFVVGYTPGGAIDTVTRTIAAELSTKWGMPVVVENRAGADGMIAAETVAHSEPDGYTVAWVNSAYAITPSKYKLSYDPIKSMIPVAEVAYGPDIVLVNSTLPVTTLKELLEYSRAHPNQITCGAGSAAAGTPYLELKSLLDQLGVSCVIAPFTGAGPAMAALLGNEVQVTTASVTIAAAQMRAGKVRALAVTSGARSAKLPDVPTVAEAGPLPGYDVSTWYGVMVPAGTPQEIVHKLHDDIVAVSHEAGVQAKLENNGLVITGTSPEQFGAHIASEIAKWAAILKPATPK